MDEAARSSTDRPGLFIRIERLCAHAFDDALESDADRQIVKRWRRGKTDLVVFLDAVDEAKLPRDLDKNPLRTAIRSVEAAAGRDIDRLRFVISSRPSAWTTEMELAEVKRLTERFTSRGQVADGDAPLSRFVRLDPLDDRQVQVLCDHVQAPTTFLPTLYDSGLAHLVQTPLDVLDFIEAFKAATSDGASGGDAFGSLKTVTDRAIERRCQDHGSPTPRNMMAVERTREGARRLALACVLGQQLVIRTPGTDGDGIDPLAALRDDSLAAWSRPEVDQLLGSGLFTSAWQGVVRFQHRRTMERLAAEALDALLEAGMSISDLVSAVTPSAFEVTILPDHFTETAGWLGTLNARYRQWLVEAAPTILVDGGDPASLPIATRIAALESLVRSYSEDEWRGYYVHHSFLSRFIAPELEGVCPRLLAEAKADEPRRILITLIWLGRFLSGLPAVYAVVEDRSLTPDIRAAALRCAFEFGEAADLPRLRLAALRFRPDPANTDIEARQSANRFRLVASAHAPPGALSTAERLGLISRVLPARHHSGSEYAKPLTEALVTTCAAEHRLRLRRWISRLSWRDQDRTLFSYEPQHYTAAAPYLLPSLQVLILRLLTETPVHQGDAEIIADLDRLLSVRETGGGPLSDTEGRADRDALFETLNTAATLRAAMFRLATEKASDDRLKQVHFVLDRYVSRHRRAYTPETADQDLDWLSALYLRSDDPRLQVAAGAGAASALRLGSKADFKRWSCPLIKRAQTLDDQATLDALRHHKPGLKQKARWWMMRHRRDIPWLNRHQRRQALRDLRWRLALIQHSRSVRDGTRSGLIWNMLVVGAHAGTDLANAVKLYGARNTELLVEGVKAFALSHEPSPHRWSSADRLAVIGWQRIAADAPWLLEAIDAASARRALGVMIDENSFPSWASELAERHLDVWCGLLAPRLKAELARRDNGMPWHPGSLALIRRQSPALSAPFAVHALTVLKAAQAPHPYAIGYAAALVASDAALIPALVRLASRRFHEHMCEGAGAFASDWLAVWMSHAPDDAWAAFEAYRTRPSSTPLCRDVLIGLGEAPSLAAATPKLLAEVALAYMRLLPTTEDVDEDSDYTTGRRQAERTRGAIPGLITDHPTSEARSILQDLSRTPEFAPHPGWIRNLLNRQARQAAAPRPWTEAQTAAFLACYLKQPASAAELHALIERHLRSILADLATSEFDRRGLLRDATEHDVRAFLGEALRQRARDWYSVTQETVTASEKRMDLRIEGRPNRDEVVVIELKIAGASWSGDQLVDHVETQLAGQYLLSKRVRRGIYLVLDLGRTSSWSMKDGDRLDFSQLTVKLSTAAAAAQRAHTHIDGLTILAETITVPPRLKRNPHIKS